MRQNTWPPRELFKADARAHRERTGLNLKEQAEAMGFTSLAWNQYLYGKTQRPSIDALERAALLFGVSVTRWLSDPHGRIPGLGTDDLASLSAAKQATMQMVFQAFSVQEITDAQAMDYARAIQAMVDAGRRR